MAYQVSTQLKEKFLSLIEMPQVQEGLEYIKEENDRSIAEQMEFCLIESPTFHETERAELLKKRLDALSVSNVCINERNNVDGVIPGTESGRILIEAHIDTVFPFGTVTDIRREGDMLYAPGIYDNARGIASMLQSIRALEHSGIKTRKSLIVAGTSREEASGGLGGMRELIAKYPDISASISVDGGFLDNITFNATYNKAVEYTFKGIGGHAFSAFGIVANPLAAACRAVVSIEEIDVPSDPKTTYAAAKIVSAEHCGITAIPDSCKLYINFRSDSQAEFDKLEAKIDECVKEACVIETQRLGRDVITAERNELVYLPGGRQDMYSNLVQANFLCDAYIAGEPQLRNSGNSNSNIPISLGIPAVTVGSGNGSNKAHTLDERFCVKDAYLCPQGLFLLLLMTLGVNDGIPSCL